MVFASLRNGRRSARRAILTPYKLAVAGRFAERHTITRMLATAQLDPLLVVVTASWLASEAESDGVMSDEAARLQVETNIVEILNADLLLYVPSWFMGTLTNGGHVWDPRWSPGRCIDVGIAMGAGVPVLIVGTPEPSIYFRGMPSCQPGELRETVGRLLGGRTQV